MDFKKLGDKFNASAKQTLEMVDDPWFTVGITGVAIVALPFSPMVSLFAMAVPTTYKAAALGMKAAARALNKDSGPDISPH